MRPWGEAMVRMPLRPIANRLLGRMRWKLALQLQLSSSESTNSMVRDGDGVEGVNDPALALQHAIRIDGCKPHHASSTSGAA